MAQLKLIGVKINEVKELLKRNSKAKELLLMGYSDPKQLDGQEEEHANLTKVWQKMEEIWMPIDQMNDTPFNVYQHKKVRELLEQKREELQNVPRFMRTYSVYEVYTDFLKSYKKVNDLFSELRADSVKSRHWSELLSKLQLPIRQETFHEMLLKHLWDANLLQRIKHIEETLTAARGEALLENFLSSSKEIWN